VALVGCSELADPFSHEAPTSSPVPALDVCSSKSLAQVAYRNIDEESSPEEKSYWHNNNRSGTAVVVELELNRTIACVDDQSHRPGIVLLLVSNPKILT
jgi:hypothetical protein